MLISQFFSDDSRSSEHLDINFPTQFMMRLWLCYYLIGDALAMFSKRQGPNRDSDDPAKRFKANIDDLFLSTDISALRAQSLYSDGAACDVPGFALRAKVGQRGSSRGNVHRDLLRQLTRRNQWPELYFAPIRVWDIKKERLVTAQLPFLLPHDCIHKFGQSCNAQVLYSMEALCQSSKAHLQQAMRELDCDLIPIGMWGDGTPCNWDRTQSIQTYCFNLPGQPGAAGQIRIVMTALNKKFLRSKHTNHDIMEVLQWSFRCLGLGVMPSIGHTGQPLKGKRSKYAGQPIPRAVLCEVRSDWAWLKETFGFPQHNEKAGICWQCDCKPGDVRSCTSDAPWKRNRLGHFGMLQRMLQTGVPISPLFGCPCFKTSCFLVDWLHCADQGVTADFLAALFLLILPKLSGRNQHERVASLWLEMQQFYRATACESRLDMLKLSMLKQIGKTPKLRSKAAECRALVPFGLSMANRFLNSGALEDTARMAMQHLQSCYELLSPQTFSAEAMGYHSQRFCLLYVALESALPQQFHLKPKLHLFQELTQMSKSCPSLFWTYRDEEFGGSVAQISKRRGGSNNPVATAKCLLHKFIAKNPLPSF